MNKFFKKINDELFTADIPLLINEPLLKAVGVKKSFSIREHEISVLNHVDFLVRLNETVAITGASGSGKSTLINILAGIDTPTKGEVYFYQHRLNILSESRLALLRSQYIGFVFQQHNLIKELTVMENILLPSLIHPQFNSMKKEKQIYAKQLVEKVGLTNRIEHYVGELSGGEAQRVAIVRAFINRPRLILADEPTGNLDQSNSNDVFLLLKHFAQIHSTAVVIVTHSLELCKKCDKVYHIEKGILSLVTERTNIKNEDSN